MAVLNLTLARWHDTVERGVAWTTPGWNFDPGEAVTGDDVIALGRTTSLGNDGNSWLGLFYLNCGIPKLSQINAAVVQLYCPTLADTPNPRIDQWWFADAHVPADYPADVSMYDISRRARVLADDTGNRNDDPNRTWPYVQITNGGVPVAGQWWSSPNLATIVQSVVSRADWVPGQPLYVGFRHTQADTGECWAGFEYTPGGGAFAAKMTITYTPAVKVVRAWDYAGA